MSFTIDTGLTCYLYPADRDDGKQAFLYLLKNPHETFIIAYGFTMSELVDEIIAANQQVPIHLYLDHSQSAGTMEKPLVQKLVDAGVDVTIGTSTMGTKYICHAKGLATLSGQCWEGSVNFSESGWFQVNTSFSFTNATWADQFIRMFETLRQYALTKEAKLQPTRST